MKIPKRLGVGFIGSGFNTRFHIQAWQGVRDADVRGIWSPNQTNAASAAKLANDFRMTLGAGWYQQTFPQTRIFKDSEEETVTTARGFRIATSTGGAITGRGADIIIAADLGKAQDVFSDAQRAAIAAFTGSEPAQEIQVATQFDEQEPFEPQLAAMIAGVPLTPDQWQSEPILVLLPSLNFITALLLAELHGRMGYFPTVVRTRPVAGTTPRRYEVAELLDLQAVRERARRSR